jgi:hypothetical protein
VRNAFILKHCSASVFPVADYQAKRDLELLESEVQALASAEELSWCGKDFPPVNEPIELVDQLVIELRLSSNEQAALLRQADRYRESHS